MLRPGRRATRSSGRMLVQALLPGLVTVAGKLRWGPGGDWQDGEEFFGELLSTTWLVAPGVVGTGSPLRGPRSPLRHSLPPAPPALSVQGPRRPHRSPRSRPRRDARHVPFGPETDLEELAGILIELHEEGDAARRGPGVCAHPVLGYSMASGPCGPGRDRTARCAQRLGEDSAACARDLQPV